MEIINGKEVSQKIKINIKKYCEQKIKLGKPVPVLAAVLVGNNPASMIYIANKRKACEETGIDFKFINLPADAKQKEVISELKKLNRDSTVKGILLQLPLPPGLDERKIINSISVKKDVDCLTDTNLGKLLCGTSKIAPCTAGGIIYLLNHYKVNCEGKHAVIIGRSMLVGRSTEILLNRLNATTTLCHSKTKNLKAITLTADILVSAVGKPNFITADMVKDGTVVIDVGINRIDKGITGDADFKNIKNKAGFITPVPGGVGPMTVATLLSNLIKLTK